METMTNSPYNFDILPTIWDISTLKKSFFVNLMLPKCLWNHTKFAPKFLNMVLIPPPFWTMLKKTADLVYEGTPNYDDNCGNFDENYDKNG